MIKKELDDMVNGWFLGDFDPAILQTKDCEVGVKNYKKGDREASHHHKVAKEITVILRGKVRMLDEEWTAGDILLLEPGESTSFEALTDCTNLVVKIPSVRGDKYFD